MFSVFSGLGQNKVGISKKRGVVDSVVRLCGEREGIEPSEILYFTVVMSF